MSFARAQALADAVLLEGYVLYPYRASSTKNRFRWTFGVLAPPTWSEAGGCEAWWLESQCLIAPGPGPMRLHGRLRFLHAQTRQVEEALDEYGERFRPVALLEVDGAQLLSWEEGVVCEIDFAVPVADGDAEQTVPFSAPAHREEESVRAHDRLRGRVVRERSRLEGVLRIRTERLVGDAPLLKLTVRVENHTPWSAPEAKREEAMRGSLIATHLLFSVAGGAFLSLLDPPEWAEEAVKGCHNVRTYPVLAGETGRADLVLSAPIILYDHAQIAPESPGDLFDATEIDEILTLRTSLLTDEEKREARATDARAAALVDRVDALPPAQRERLHGALRALHRAEMVPRGHDAGTGARSPYVPGCKVRILPSKRRTDAQDLLFIGCTATVHVVLRDVDDHDHVAVTLDEDPAAELHRWYGRYHYYAFDEVELLEAAPQEVSP